MTEKQHRDWDATLTAAGKFGDNGEGHDWFLLVETRSRVVHLAFLAGDEPSAENAADQFVDQVTVFLGDFDGGDVLGSWRPDRGWFDLYRGDLNPDAQRALEPMARATWDAAQKRAQP